MSLLLLQKHIVVTLFSYACNNNLNATLIPNISMRTVWHFKGSIKHDWDKLAVMVVFQEVAAWGLGVKQRKGEIQVEIQKLNHFKVRVAPEGWNIVEPPEQGLLPHQPDQMMPTSSTSSSSSTSSTSCTPTISSCQLTHGNLKLKVRSKSERVQVVGPLNLFQMVV